MKYRIRYLPDQFYVTKPWVVQRRWCFLWLDTTRWYSRHGAEACLSKVQLTNNSGLAAELDMRIASAEKFINNGCNNCGSDDIKWAMHFGGCLFRLGCNSCSKDLLLFTKKEMVKELNQSTKERG